jgi:O-antigen/teichoic acid export membrane protein
MKIALRSNAIAAASEQLVVGLSFLGFYGYLIRIAGAEAVGVLSLVLVLASVGALASTGFGSAVGRFAPYYEGRGDRDATVRCIETAILCSTALYAAILAVAYVPFDNLISQQAGAQYRSLVAGLMPAATAYVFMMGVGAATTPALTSLQRSDLRLWANVAGVAGCWAITLWGVPTWGIAAALWGLAAQATIVAVVSWIQLRHIVPQLSIVPRKFSRAMAKDLLRLGGNLQVQSLLIAATDPIARLLVGHFGALSDVAYFSMASRFVLQVRSLIFAASQPLLSAFSHIGTDDVPRLSELYRRANDVIGIVTLLALSAAAGAAPFVGEMWLGQREDSFVVYVAMLAAGWLVNTMVLASYFMAYALARLSWNLAAHIALFGVNLALAPVLGYFYGATGVVAAMAIALLVYGLIMTFGNPRLAPEIIEVRWGAHAFLFASTVLGAAGAIASYYWLRTEFSALVSGIACGLVWLVAIAPATLTRPAVKALLRSRGSQAAPT